MPIAVVVNKGATCIPTRTFARHACLLAHVGKRSVPVVVIQNIFSEVGHVQVVPSVVVVVTDANALSPAGMRDAGFRGNVGECAVAIIAEKMRSGFTACREAFEARAVYQKNVEPSVVVVIVKGNPASRCFQQIFVLMFAAVDGLRIQTGFARDVEKADAQVRVRCWLLLWLRVLLRLRCGASPSRTRQREYALEGKHKC